MLLAAPLLELLADSKFAALHFPISPLLRPHVHPQFPFNAHRKLSAIGLAFVRTRQLEVECLQQLGRGDCCFHQSKVHPEAHSRPCLEYWIRKLARLDKSAVFQESIRSTKYAQQFNTRKLSALWGCHLNSSGSGHRSGSVTNVIVSGQSLRIDSQIKEETFLCGLCTGNQEVCQREQRVRAGKFSCRFVTSNSYYESDGI